MAYLMARIPMTLSEFEGHFCCYERRNASHGPSTSAELPVLTVNPMLTGPPIWKQRVALAQLRSKVPAG